MSMLSIKNLRASSHGLILVTALVGIYAIWHISSSIQEHASLKTPSQQPLTSSSQLTSNLFFLDNDKGLEDELSLQEKEKEFYTFIRTHVIYFITFILLYLLSCFIISIFSKHKDNEFGLDLEEHMIYKISTWMCAFTLAISIAAFLLLPVSITTNEISWIDDPQTKWSLLNGLWSYVFLFSNISLFILLPFAYFFTESEGFSGSRRGIMSRLRETLVLLSIVAILVLGMTYVVCCLFVGIGCHINGIQILTVWQYLPFLYSCLSFIGALLLLLCTPVGISHLFTVFHELDAIQHAKKINYAIALIILIILAGSSVITAFYNTIQLFIGYRSLPMSTALTKCSEFASSSSFQTLSTSEQLSVINQSDEYSCLRKTNGPIFAIFEIIMILYLWCASLCGLYSLPGLCSLKPRIHNSSFNRVVGNCAVLCLLSSALPLFSRTLGMTNFDLLGDFGRVEWLGNFYVVLCYNLVFLISTTLCLMGQREKVVTLSLLNIIIGKKSSLESNSTLHENKQSVPFVDLADDEKNEKLIKNGQDEKKLFKEKIM